MRGNQGVPTHISTEAALVVEGRTDGRMMETLTGRSAPSNHTLMLPEGGPDPEVAHLFSCPPPWIHPARSGSVPTQIGSLNSGPTHMRVVAPGERLEVLIQVGEV